MGSLGPLVEGFLCPRLPFARELQDDKFRSDPSFDPISLSDHRGGTSLPLGTARPARFDLWPCPQQPRLICGNILSVIHGATPIRHL